MVEKDINSLNNLTFEETLKKLEGNVSSLESGDLGLEEAIKVYEEGIKYSNYLIKKLESAEKKVEELTAKDNNTGEQSLDRRTAARAPLTSSLSTKPLEID
ncbi:MAG: exodeoxyribonuclease VII small subunit [Candidatus Acidulodesulfobacterium ferriphilum]|uniref:Exodeoxyribonuclease 7 small subunit n=1 Tax=Candidatus Acidulodesulfobacterium ferriphilum TaxID=2597223 RepID=A0A519B9S0_9DELT|nr:MAG: exodeoxyribonuclease VII small subunit [Candidatus Acidulodesulfobacterium ferriphilum]